MTKTVGFNSEVIRRQHRVGTDGFPALQIERVLVGHHGQIECGFHAAMTVASPPSRGNGGRDYLLNDFVKSSAVFATTFFSWRELAMSSLSFVSHALLSIGSSMLWPMSEE